MIVTGFLTSLSPLLEKEQHEKNDRNVLSYVVVVVVFLCHECLCVQNVRLSSILVCIHRSNALLFGCKKSRFLSLMTVVIPRECVLFSCDSRLCSFLHEWPLASYLSKGLCMLGQRLSRSEKMQREMKQSKFFTIVECLSDCKRRQEESCWQRQVSDIFVFLFENHFSKCLHRPSLCLEVLSLPVLSASFPSVIIHRMACNAFFCMTGSYYETLVSWLMSTWTLPTNWLCIHYEYSLDRVDHFDNLMVGSRFYFRSSHDWNHCFPDNCYWSSLRAELPAICARLHVTESV